jgi:limonene-1,2-epoxide hydrolase
MGSVTVGPPSCEVARFILDVTASSVPDEKHRAIARAFVEKENRCLLWRHSSGVLGLGGNMSTKNEALIRAFCAAWQRRDIEELVGFFTHDAVYHNMPMAPVRGHDGIRKAFHLFVPPAQSIEFEVLNMASTGSVVFTERIDRFVMGEKKVELPVAGVFEIRDDKISVWRDYFDLPTWTRQTS